MDGAHRPSDVQFFKNCLHDLQSLKSKFWIHRDHRQITNKLRTNRVVGIISQNYYPINTTYNFDKIPNKLCGWPRS